MTPLNLESESRTLPENTSPGWLQRIRDRSQSEQPDTPPLGEFGEVENRPFDQSITPGEIPDWLKELQNSEPPQKEETSAADIDWITRLHEIQAGSNQSLSQSTTFYSGVELAAMAAAARKLDQSDELVEDKTSKKHEEQNNSSDFSGQESEPQLPVERPDESGVLVNQPEEPFTDEISRVSLQPEEESITSEEELAPWLKMIPPTDYSSELPTPDFTGETNFAFSSETQPEAKFPIPDVPEIESALPDEEGKKPPLSSFFAPEDEEQSAGDAVTTAEPLIPEAVLQPQYSRAAEYSGRLEISESQRNSITLLKSMLVGEIQPQNPSPERSKFSGRFLRAVIGILLLIVMGYPFFTGFLLLKPQALFSPGVVAMHNTVGNLPENASFLIVTDFEPAFSGEMRAAATGLIDNLMMKEMNFTVISTVPSGPALARYLLNTVRPATFAYPQEKIAVLGFIPGGTTGLQDFIRNPRQAAPLLDSGAYAWTYPAAQAVSSIQDYAGVLVITENAETGRAWIEQLHGSMVDKPLLMVVSAQSAPIIRPYLDSGQLSGLISGRVEGAMYDRLMDAPPRAALEMSSYQMGMLFAVGLVALGGLYGLLKKLFIRQLAGSSEEWHAG